MFERCGLLRRRPVIAAGAGRSSPKAFKATDFESVCNETDSRIKQHELILKQVVTLVFGGQRMLLRYKENIDL